MRLVKRNGVIGADPYRRLADDAPLIDGPVIVSWTRWMQEQATLQHCAQPIGVQLPNTTDLAAAWPLLANRPLIELEFPAFGDGRAYSQAVLLRQRYRYAGELRAQGLAVVQDQAAELLRCGFDSFALRADQPSDGFIERLKTAGQQTWYQHGLEPTVAHVGARRNHRADVHV